GQLRALVADISNFEDGIPTEAALNRHIPVLVISRAKVFIKATDCLGTLGERHCLEGFPIWSERETHVPQVKICAGIREGSRRAQPRLISGDQIGYPQVMALVPNAITHPQDRLLLAQPGNAPAQTDSRTKVVPIRVIKILLRIDRILPDLLNARQRSA